MSPTSDVLLALTGEHIGGAKWAAATAAGLSGLESSESATGTPPH